MNPLQRFRASDGTMADFFPNPQMPSIYPPAGIYTPTVPVVAPSTSGSGGSKWDWLTPLIGAGVQIGSTILQTRAASQGQVFQQQYTPQQLAAIQQAQMGQQQIVSGGVNSGGIQIGNTYISWMTIILAGGALLLIQSRPFSR
jgi:hypothetical protein